MGNTPLLLDFKILKEALYHVFVNAVKFSNRNATIVITGQVVLEKYLMVTVEDSGLGITKQ